MRYLFEEYALDADRRELHRGTTLIPVEPQVLDLLLYLIRNRQRVVSKDDLLSSVWRGRVVSESALTTRINAARSALGDSGHDQRYIRTLPRKGLRFVGSIQEDQAMADPAQLGAKPGAALAAKPSIAVLPFANLSGDPEQEYFSDGISEDIIAALSKLRWFVVIARNSSFSYKGKPAPRMKQIADDLGVGYVVEGSVRREGDRVRINAQLSDVASGSHVWSERYDRRLADVFAVQDEITEAIVAAIEPQLYVAENFRAQRKPPESMDAWDLVMRALSHYWRVTRQDNIVAQALLDKAVEIDPSYGQALGALATSHMFCVHMGWSDIATVVPIAKRAALAAIRIDGEDSWPHHALACAYLFTRRFEDALAEFELALRLNPNFSQARGYYGLALACAGRWEEAFGACVRALRSSPRDPFSSVYTAIGGFAQFLGRNYEDSMRLASEAIRQRGEFAGAYRVLAAAAGMAGRAEVAAAALDNLRQAQPGISLDWIATHMPIAHDADRQHYMEGLRRAGLD